MAKKETIKKTFVDLKVKKRSDDETDKIRKFEIGHAERILKLRNGGGYELPKNSKFEFVENGLRTKQG